MPNVRISRMVVLFGSATEVAKICGVTKGAVSRWLEGRYKINPKYQAKLIAAARVRRLDIKELVWLLDIQLCPHCQQAIHPEVHAAISGKKIAA